jgi:hypothetical protein
VDIYIGKYYPAISLFSGSRVQVNFGPDFAHYDTVADEHINVKGIYESKELKKWCDIVDEYTNAESNFRLIK